MYNFKTEKHKNKFHEKSHNKEMKTTTKGGTLNPFFNVARNDIVGGNKGGGIKCLLFLSLFIYARLFFVR